MKTTNNVLLTVRAKRKIIFSRSVDLEVIHKRLVDITLKADKSFILNMALLDGETFKYKDALPQVGNVTCTVKPLVNGQYLKSNMMEA